jgi:hypothetical protein
MSIKTKAFGVNFPEQIGELIDFTDKTITIRLYDNFFHPAEDESNGVRILTWDQIEDFNGFKIDTEKFIDFEEVKNGIHYKVIWFDGVVDEAWFDGDFWFNDEYDDNGNEKVFSKPAAVIIIKLEDGE